jgi:alkanesulfonate monooxygenase SsuD/methylene tetrahydromethanopterin reductase-like flavin-dependent oxidoreductase (luciferase family)
LVAGYSRWIARKTTDVGGTSRPPILTAKTLATIDVLSKGRVIVGCGVGWMREEFEALGSPPFEKRGAVCDDYIRAFREL